MGFLKPALAGGRFTGVYLAGKTVYIASKYLLSFRCYSSLKLKAELRGPMKFDWMIKSLLLAILVLLAVIAFRPAAQPPSVLAQSGLPYPYWIEQGTVSLKKPEGNISWGKVVVDMRTGDVWGFPMKAQNTPYPVYGPSDNSKVSHPMYLGRMAFEEAVRQ